MLLGNGNCMCVCEIKHNLLLGNTFFCAIESVLMASANGGIFNRENSSMQKCKVIPERPDP